MKKPKDASRNLKNNDYKRSTTQTNEDFTDFTGYNENDSPAISRHGATKTNFDYTQTNQNK